MNRKTLSVVLTTLALLGAVSSTFAQIGELVTYQGRLASNNVALSGSYDLRFTIYDSLGGATVISGPTINSAVTVSNGLFTTQIAVSGAGAIFNGSDRYLEVAVRTNGGAAFVPLTPRQQFTPTPFAFYAIKAGTANGVTAGAVGNAGLQDGAVTAAKIGGGNVVKTLNSLKDDITFSAGANVTLTPSGQTLTLASPTDWHAGGNAGTSPTTNFLGTTDNQALELRVNNQRVLRLEPGTNIVGGSSANSITGGVVGSTIAGGGDSTGWPNNISSGANYSAIGGGHGNMAGDVESTVAGGGLNHATGQKTFIGGGFGNTASGYGAMVAGGVGNYAVGGYSMVGGGSGNTNGNDYSVIGGGLYNTNTGSDNVIGGGYQNLTSGAYNVVPGGANNAATGMYSFAAGHRAKSVNPGAFVWADSTEADFTSTISDQFLIRAGNGVGIGTNNPRSALHVNGTVTASNYVGSGASLSSLNATNVAAGTLPDARLSTNVALLNASQTFSGANTFRNFNAADGPGTNSGSMHVGGYAANGDPKLIYFGDGAYVYLGENRTDDTMELHAARYFFNGGNVGIGLTNPLVPLQVAGTMSATSVGIGTTSPSDSLLEVQGDIRLSTHDLYLREGTDRNHGLGWYGAGKLFAGVNLDGPVLYGCDGGGLGSGCTTSLALRWKGDGSIYVGGTLDTLGATNLEFRVNGTRALRLEQSLAGNGAPNVVGGSITNSVDAGYYGATIAGGGATNWGGSGYPNRIVALFGTIGGGANNLLSTNVSFGTIAGGYNNSVQRDAQRTTIAGGSGNSIKTSASYSTIGGGSANVIQTNATYSIVAGGQGNSIGTSSTRGTIGGGYFNSIATNAEYATVPGGKDAIASHYGQFAYASGRMVYPGDAQTSMYVLRTAVNASTFSSLYLDANSLMLTVPSNSVWGFEVMVVGALAGGPAAVYKFTGAIRNFGGTVAFVGTPTKTVVAEDAAASAWDAQVVVNYGALDIQGKGGGTGYVSWVATVHTTEVTPYY